MKACWESSEEALGFFLKKLSVAVLGLHLVDVLLQTEAQVSDNHYELLK
jgi:hypothetical protein